MSPQRAKQIGLVSIATSIAVLAGSARYAFAPLPRSPELVSSLEQRAANQNALESDAGLIVSAAALAATLRDDLFPDPPPPPAERSAPRLSLELVAILGGEDDRSAYVFEPQSNQYHKLAPGDSAPGGAVLASVEPTTAVFDLAGREVRLELRP